MKSKLERLMVIASVILVALASSSCSKDRLPDEKPKIEKEEYDPRLVGVKTMQERADIELAGVDPIAKRYFDNVKTLAYATGALQPQTWPKTRSGHDSTVDLTLSLNPIVAKIASLEYQDSLDRPVQFYNQPANEQVHMFELELIYQTQLLTERLKGADELNDVLVRENRVTDSIIEASGIQRLKIGQMPDSAKTMIRVPDQWRFDGKPIPQVKGRSVFRSIDEELVDAPHGDGDMPHEYRRVRSGSTNHITTNISIYSLITSWEQYAKRGWIALRLPKHGHRYTIINFGDDGDSKFSVGHAGIFVKDFKLDKPWVRGDDEVVKEKITVDAYGNDGVQERPASSWQRKHYILGMRWRKCRWISIGWGTSELAVWFEDVTDYEKMAKKAESYIGRGYVRWHEFLHAKWVADAYFTCTTLVWWCAKKEYGILLSPWTSKKVTPTAIYRDENAFIRHEVLYKEDPERPYIQGSRGYILPPKRDDRDGGHSSHYKEYRPEEEPEEIY